MPCRFYHPAGGRTLSGTVAGIDHPDLLQPRSGWNTDRHRHSADCWKRGSDRPHGTSGHRITPSLGSSAVRIARLRRGSMVHMAKLCRRAGSHRTDAQSLCDMARELSRLTLASQRLPDRGGSANPTYPGSPLPCAQSLDSQHGNQNPR